jgi:hypothetical protein
MAAGNANVFTTPTAGDAALAEVVRRLAETYRPDHIYLFGEDRSVRRDNFKS